MEKMGTLMFKTHGEGVGVANCQKKNLKIDTSVAT